MRERLAEVVSGGDELVLSPPVLIEILRAPQGSDVASERARLTADLQVLPFSPNTLEIAADAMELLADHEPEAHRLPVADLLTAVVAHEQGVGVIHCDDDFEALANHAGLTFPEERLEVDSDRGSPHPIAGRQRELKKQLFQVLHQLPVDDAEKLLESWVAQAQRQRSS